jgi:hypothetical protein
LESGYPRTSTSKLSARANLITNYRVSDGRLKGLNVGGAIHWRAAPSIGYGTATSPGGATVPDLNRAHEVRAETYVNLPAGYCGRLKAFGGCNHRVKVNTRNALNRNDPIPGRRAEHRRRLASGHDRFAADRDDDCGRVLSRGRSGPPAFPATRRRLTWVRTDHLPAQGAGKKGRGSGGCVRFVYHGKRNTV